MKTYSRKKADDQEEVIVDLNDLCRLCMTKEEGLISIFDPEENNIPLPLRIMACVAIEIVEGDGLPNKICHPCKYQLDKSYSFRKKCDASDQKLRMHLRTLQERFGENFELCSLSCEIDPTYEQSQTSETESVTKQASTITALGSEETSDKPVYVINPHSSTTGRQREVSVSSQEENIREDEDHAEVEGETSEVATEEIDHADTIEERELVGVTQVTYIAEPEAEAEDDPENITLPKDGNILNKEACTLMTVKKEQPDDHDDGVYVVDEEGNMRKITNPTLENSNGTEERIIGDTELDAIAEAVKSTLASHPQLNLSGDLQFKLDQHPGKPTQIQVIADDGSVVIMELMPDQAEAQELQNIHDDGFNEEGELKVFQCPDCPKSFARRIQLRRHSSVHMQQRGFSCGICEKWFPTRSALVRHERIHTGERPFQCEICQKSFAQKEILFRHLMTHTGQKPYNCPHCPKGFTQKEPLRVHLKSHVNTTPADVQLHYCTLCPKVFCHASGLSRHLVTHTGKTFKCRDCDKSFTDKSSLRRHHRQSNHQE